MNGYHIRSLSNTQRGFKMIILSKKQKFILEHANGISVSDIARKHPTYLPTNLYNDVKILIEEDYINKKIKGRQTILTQTIKGQYSI